MTAAQRHDRPSPLAWAALFSVLAHLVMVVVPMASHGRHSDSAAEPADVIEAILVAAPASATLVESPAVSLPPETTREIALPPVPSVPAIGRSAPHPVGGSQSAMPAGVLVEAQALQDRDRLGDVLLTRQITEFPVELDYPVRLAGKIIVPYPPAALAAGREGAVAVWVLVDEKGGAEEIDVTEGSEEFANAVTEAIRAAHFLPAQNNLAPIRFPISLEFQFKASDTTAAALRP
jgi:TonB family protein